MTRHIVLKHFNSYNIIIKSFLFIKRQDIPFDKVNKLLNKENYIWVNILEENEWRDKFKDNLWLK